MTRPPRPDKMPGPIRYKKPTGKKEDSALERLHQERKQRRKADPAPSKRRRT
jgi:hypothetical protein